MAVRISRSERRSSASLVRWLVTLASGITAAARIIRIVDTISSSTNVKPRAAAIRTRMLAHRHRGRRELQRHHRALRRARNTADLNQRVAGTDGIEEQRADQA